MASKSSNKVEVPEAKAAMIVLRLRLPLNLV